MPNISIIEKTQFYIEGKPVDAYRLSDIPGFIGILDLKQLGNNLNTRSLGSLYSLAGDILDNTASSNVINNFVSKLSVDQNRKQNIITNAKASLTPHVKDNNVLQDLAIGTINAVEQGFYLAKNGNSLALIIDLKIKGPQGASTVYFSLSEIEQLRNRMFNKDVFNLEKAINDVTAPEYFKAIFENNIKERNLKGSYKQFIDDLKIAFRPQTKKADNVLIIKDGLNLILNYEQEIAKQEQPKEIAAPSKGLQEMQNNTSSNDKPNETNVIDRETQFNSLKAYNTKNKGAINLIALLESGQSEKLEKLLSSLIKDIEPKFNELDILSEKLSKTAGIKTTEYKDYYKKKGIKPIESKAPQTFIDNLQLNVNPSYGASLASFNYRCEYLLEVFQALNRGGIIVDNNLYYNMPNYDFQKGFSNYFENPHIINGNKYHLQLPVTPSDISMDTIFKNTLEIFPTAFKNLDVNLVTAKKLNISFTRTLEVAKIDDERFANLFKQLNNQLELGTKDFSKYLTQLKQVVTPVIKTEVTQAIKKPENEPANVATAEPVKQKISMPIPTLEQLFKSQEAPLAGLKLPEQKPQLLLPQFTETTLKRKEAQQLKNKRPQGEVREEPRKRKPKLYEFAGSSEEYNVNPVVEKAPEPQIEVKTIIDINGRKLHIKPEEGQYDNLNFLKEDNTTVSVNREKSLIVLKYSSMYEIENRYVDLTASIKFILGQENKFIKSEGVKAQTIIDNRSDDLQHVNAALDLTLKLDMHHISEFLKKKGVEFSIEQSTGNADEQFLHKITIQTKDKKTLDFFSNLKNLNSEKIVDIFGGNNVLGQNYPMDVKDGMIVFRQTSMAFLTEYYLPKLNEIGQLAGIPPKLKEDEIISPNTQNHYIKSENPKFITFVKNLIERVKSADIEPSPSTIYSSR